MTRLAGALLVLASVAACQARPAPLPATSPQPVSVSPVASATPAPGIAMAGQRFEVRQGAGRAIMRIREQLMTWSAPDDAILSLDAIEGTFAVRDDGTFDPASLLRGELARLQSDDFRRANAARETMNADRFPFVEFRPIRALELTLPLPASGKWDFKLVGALTVNGVERDLEWRAVADRQGSQLVVTARTSFRFGDFGMAPPRRGPVLSIVDEVRLEVEVTAHAIRDAAADCVATPQDVPANYVADAPVRSRIGSGGYMFGGTVRSTASCAPLPGARVEIWLANADGRYDADHRAVVIADATGRYTIETSVPPGYGGGSSHIHLRVSAARHLPLVSIFFPRSGTSSGEMDLVLRPG